MIEQTRPKYPTELHGNIYIDNIQKAVIICLIISTKFPFDTGPSIKKIPGCMTYVVHPGSSIDVNITIQVHRILWSGFYHTGSLIK